MFAIDGIDDPKFKSVQQTIRGRLNQMYLKHARSIVSSIPWPFISSFLLTHRSQFGLPWLLFTPFRILGLLKNKLNGSIKNNHPISLEDKLSHGDIIFLPDATWTVDVFPILKQLKIRGVRVAFLIHDIFPITHPDMVDEFNVMRFRPWFHQVTSCADLLVFNSNFTQECVANYVGAVGHRLPAGEVVHLGYDLNGIEEGPVAHKLLRHALATIPRPFLCVGTIEPRKNYGTILSAFEQIWCDPHMPARLVIIGRAGWLCDDLIQRIMGHAELNNRLFWFDNVTDRDLAIAYQCAHALIIGSTIEGFGLPLVEALSQRVPIIASDIPVFREIAGNHARYFDPARPDILADAVMDVLAVPSNSQSMEAFVWPSWEDSTRELLTVLQRLVGDNSHFLPPAVPQPNNPSPPAG